MTTQNRRDMPHPVLRPGGRDYGPEARFDLKAERLRKVKSEGKLYLPVTVTLQEPDIERLIAEDRAEITVMTDCPASHTRECHPVTAGRTTLELDSREYAKQVGIQPFIITSTNVPEFRAEGWSAWTKRALQNGASLPAGAILAIGSMNGVSLDAIREVRSCVQIIPTPQADPGEFDVRLDGDTIDILVNPEDKLRIERMRDNQEEQDSLWPSVYLGAVERAVRECAKEEVQRRMWARSVRKALADQGIDHSDEEEMGNNSLKYAQRVMSRPLARILQEKKGI